MGHQVGTQVERAYRRTDVLEKRRALMEAWANWCEPNARCVFPECIDASSILKAGGGSFCVSVLHGSARTTSHIRAELQAVGLRGAAMRRMHCATTIDRSKTSCGRPWLRRYGGRCTDRPGRSLRSPFSSRCRAILWRDPPEALWPTGRRLGSSALQFPRWAKSALPFSTAWFPGFRRPRRSRQRIMLIDATIVRAHSIAPALKKRRASHRRSRGGLTTKIHAFVDALGSSTTAPERGERAAFEQLEKCRWPPSPTKSLHHPNDRGNAQRLRPRSANDLTQAPSTSSSASSIFPALIAIRWPLDCRSTSSLPPSADRANRPVILQWRHSHSLPI